ncbi:hypothetical protein QBC34DRAFT_443561 [Podospora aff. communis PSN243]|uniref:Nephrocystin 3-like N-terminal domain-containing protein n=1 Tax=Podospora aff. communis PSN243 TaxID=3040156 RepID=A0AAV9G580_9PEZI|nr:hypothetical protein QBC34DRAFT_443561 [Podospora aff. communis PSN243]
MEPSQPLIYRRSTLTNSAAEFIENRAGREVLMQLGDVTAEHADDLQNTTEFIPEIDQFARKGVVFDAAKYYEESAKSMVKFQQTLERLTAILKTRNVEKELQIDAIKSPNDPSFNLEYVLSITNKLQEGRENAVYAKTCKGFIRRCYRKAERHLQKDTVQGILGLVPNDVYGSVISGGFTLILAAVEKHASQRETIQKWLATIPETLDGCQRLADLHRTSPRLHEHLNHVLVAVFFVLERIVDSLSNTFETRMTESEKVISDKADRMKAIFKRPKASAVAKHDTIGTQPSAPSLTDDKDSGKTVDDALSELKGRMESFQREVDICAQERLGRIEQTVKVGALVMRATGETMARVENDLAWIKSFEERFLLKVREESSTAAKDLLVQLENALYRFCTSNPHFDSKTGGLDSNQAKRLAIEAATMATQSRIKTNKAVAAKWLNRLRESADEGFNHTPQEDLEDCLSHQEKLGPDEKDVASYILESETLDSWNRADNSSILVIDLPTSPSELNNPLSFAASVYILALASQKKYPVLAFFCKHRNNASHEEQLSGAMGLLNSLNGQLLDFITEYRPDANLGRLHDKEFAKKSRTTIKYGLKLFEELISVLPEGDRVFIIIDSMSCISGSEEEGHKIIKKITRIMEDSELDVTIKLLVTDPSADSPAREVADVTLTVPDGVNGSGTLHTGQEDVVARLTLEE